MKNPTENTAIPITIIEPSKGWIPVDFKEIWKYRELLYFLTKREIQVRYKQTILGGLWAIIQPFFTMVVFTLFFGRLAKMPSDGIPYPIFVYAGLLPWTYCQCFVCLRQQSGGKRQPDQQGLFPADYYPRIFIPGRPTRFFRCHDGFVCHDGLL